MESFIYQFAGELLSADQVKQKTGLIVDTMDPDILEEFGIVKLTVTTQGEPNEPWTYLDGPTVSGGKVVYKHKPIDLASAKALAKPKIIAASSEHCKTECAELGLDPLLVPSLSTDGALGELKTHLDEVAAALEAKLAALAAAKSVKDVIALLDD